MPRDKLTRMVAAIGANTRQEFMDWVATANAEEALTGMLLDLANSPLGMQNMHDNELAQTTLTIEGNDAHEHLAQRVLDQPGTRRIDTSFVELADGSRLMALAPSRQRAEVIRVAEQVENTD